MPSLLLFFKVLDKVSNLSHLNTAELNQKTTYLHFAVKRTVMSMVEDAFVVRSEDHGLTSLKTLGIATDKPKCIEYAVPLKRLESFKHWPSTCSISPNVLAEAGFFYTGITMRLFVRQKHRFAKIVKSKENVIRTRS